MQKGTGIYKITKTKREIRGCYVEGDGDIWEYKDDTREQRGYVEEHGDTWRYKDNTKDGIRWDMLNNTGIVDMEIQGGYQ